MVESLKTLCSLSSLITKEYFAPLTPQTGVVERKNRTLEEMARVMLHAKNLLLYF